MPALRALEESDQHIGLARVGVHRAQLHGHFRFVPLAMGGVVVGHDVETTPGAQMFLVSVAQALTGTLVLHTHPYTCAMSSKRAPQVHVQSLPTVWGAMRALLTGAKVF